MSSRQSVLGLGDLTYDHVFQHDRNEVIYRGSRGGGSVFNLLVNVSHLGGVAFAAGVGGNDRFGHAAISELNSLNVNTSHIELLNGRSTLTVFESVDYVRSALWQRPRPSMSLTCPICESRRDDDSTARLEKKELLASDVLHGIGVVCFDRLTSNRIKLALDCHKNDILTGLDLGRNGFIRFIPASRVISTLRAFDIVVLPERVAESLIRRADLTDVQSLAGLGPRSLMYISKGERGLVLYDVRRRPDIYVTEFSAPELLEVVDDTGAGDCFFAGMVRSLCAAENPSKFLEELNQNEVCEKTFESITALEPVLSHIGARGHIPTALWPESSVNAELLGLNTQEIKERIDLSRCPFCSNQQKTRVRTSRPLKVGAKTNLQWLENRVLFALENRLAIDGCRKILKQRGTAYVIGTGGSYPAAVFIASLLNRNADFFAQAIHPYDYIKTAKSSDWVFIITYSGSTSDCAEAMRHAATLDAHSIVLVTGVTDPKLKVLLRNNDSDVLISYGPPSDSGRMPRERGFVSIAGTVAPCAVWTAAVLGVAQMIKFVERFDSAKDLSISGDWESGIAKLRHCLEDELPLTVLGGGLCWPAILDLESKFVEARLGTLQLHETKDFSHGRFMSLLSSIEENVVVFLHLGSWNSYEKRLLKTLTKTATVVVLDSEDASTQGALELLIKVQFFAQTCAALIGKDLSRPGQVPKEGLELYHWNKGLE